MSALLLDLRRTPEAVRDDAITEGIAVADEAITSAELIVNATLHRSPMAVINIANRLSMRAMRSRDELRRLGDGDAA